MRTYAHLTPEVLRWARESSGYSVQEAAAKIGVSWSLLEAAEEGYDLLTLRQAEKAAVEYDRPLAALFLPRPPVEEPQEARFRRLPGAPIPPWPPGMHLLARRVRDRQQAAVELHELLDETPPWIKVLPRLRVAERGSLATVVRDLLEISFDEQESWLDASGYAPLRHWVDAVEALGVLVMQDSTLPVATMRGFASIHPAVPAIVVNTGDDPRSRAFTVIHELGHLALAANGVEVGPPTEAWCDDFAGQVLAPRHRVERAFKHNVGHDLTDRTDRLARLFGLTPLATAVRLSRYGLVDEPSASRLIARIQHRGATRVPTGGHYYRTEIGKLGPSFIRLVFSALESQALTYPAASRLLGVKVNNFARLRDHLDERAGSP